MLAVLGLCVMRSVYDRLHYVGLAGFGALLIGVSIVVRESFSLIGDKALLVGGMRVIAGPVMVQTTARSQTGRSRSCSTLEALGSRGREHQIGLHRHPVAVYPGGRLRIIGVAGDELAHQRGLDREHGI